MNRLLLIDDDPEIVSDQVARALSSRGIRIEVARTGEEGVRRVAADPPDVILLDVRLPDLSGAGGSTSASA